MFMTSIFLSFAKASLIASGLMTSALTCIVIWKHAFGKERLTERTFVIEMIGFFAVFAVSAIVFIVI